MSSTPVQSFLVFFPPSHHPCALLFPAHIRRCLPPSPEPLLRCFPFPPHLIHISFMIISPIISVQHGQLRPTKGGGLIHKFGRKTKCLVSVKVMCTQWFFWALLLPRVFFSQLLPPSPRPTSLPSSPPHMPPPPSQPMRTGGRF